MSQTASSDLRKNCLIALVLFALVFAVFGRVFHHEFIIMDDPDFFTGNVHVQNGLTGSALGWAFTNTDASDWFPLTWVSILIDYQLFGPSPGRHLLMNVLYHGLNAVLLFLFLLRATGSRWRSAAVSLLFAVHPLRVESVAWAVERKDVLSGFFWLLTLLAYARWTRQKGPRNYLLSIACYACACLSKATVVTLPLVLLLLDVWPLQRFRAEPFRRLFFEKLPFFLMAAATSVMAYLPKAGRHVLSGLETHPIGLRLSNSLIFYVQYLEKTFWPRDLAIFYPYPGQAPSAAAVIACGLLLGILTLAAVRSLKKCPACFTGWFWFLITLLPVIGLIKFAGYGIADRYLYLPHMGLFIGLVWAVAEGIKDRRSWTKAALIGFCAVSAVLAVTAWRQTGYWKDSVTINERALQVDPRNFQAHNNLGMYEESRGRLKEALAHYRQSGSMDPDVMNHYASLLLQSGRTEEAVQTYSRILAVSPDHPNALINLGLAFIQQGQPDLAEAFLERASRLPSPSPKTFLGLADIRQHQGRLDEAWTDISKALELDPVNEEANYLAGNFKVARHAYGDAKVFYEKVLKKDPGHFKAALNLANILFLEKRYEDAAAYYKEAVRLRPDFVLAHLNLGKTYARLGKIPEARREYQEVLRRDPQNEEAPVLLEKTEG